MNLDCSTSSHLPVNCGGKFLTVGTGHGLLLFMEGDRLFGLNILPLSLTLLLQFCRSLSLSPSLCQNFNLFLLSRSSSLSISWQLSCCPSWLNPSLPRGPPIFLADFAKWFRSGLWSSSPFVYAWFLLSFQISQNTFLIFYVKFFWLSSAVLTLVTNNYYKYK